MSYRKWLRALKCLIRSCEESGRGLWFDIHWTRLYRLESSQESSALSLGLIPLRSTDLPALQDLLKYYHGTGNLRSLTIADLPPAADYDDLRSQYVPAPVSSDIFSRGLRADLGLL